MKTVSIDHLVYAMKSSNMINPGSKTGAIFFLGAGMSSTGNIPLAWEIAKEIKETYVDNPRIKELGSLESDYAKLMDALLPVERNSLIKKYVEESKINAAHIYLANILKEGYADYILTVNFDNLMFKAATLFNKYPPVYDLAILKDFTTSKFHNQSIIHLHGHFQGLWMLNTLSEMQRVDNVVPKIFDTIKDNRPWVVIGYGGTDLVFEHLKKMGRFDNGLYWVGYENNQPPKHVKDFLDEPHTNAFYIQGYNADTFMAELNHHLNLKEPTILEKPFSHLSQVLRSISAESFDSETPLLSYDNNRLEINDLNVGRAMTIFETHNHGTFYRLTSDDYYKKLDDEINSDFLSMEIRKIKMNNNFDNDSTYDALLDKFRLVRNSQSQKIKSNFLAIRASELSNLLKEEKEPAKANHYLGRIKTLLEKSKKELEGANDYKYELSKSVIKLDELVYWDRNNPSEIIKKEDYFKETLAIYDLTVYNDTQSEVYFKHKQIQTCLILSKHLGDHYTDDAFKLIIELIKTYNNELETKGVVIHFWDEFIQYITDEKVFKKYIDGIIDDFNSTIEGITHPIPWSIPMLLGDFYMKSYDMEITSSSNEKLVKALGYYNISTDLGAPIYGKAVCYLKMGDQKLAFEILASSLENQEIDLTVLHNSKIWKEYLQDPQVIELLEKHKDSSRIKISCKLKIRPKKEEGETTIPLRNRKRLLSYEYIFDPALY